MLDRERALVSPASVTRLFCRLENCSNLGRWRPKLLIAWEAYCGCGCGKRVSFGTIEGTAGRLCDAHREEARFARQVMTDQLRQRIAQDVARGVAKLALESTGEEIEGLLVVLDEGKSSIESWEAVP